MNPPFPSKPIHFIVPADPGGVPDVLARTLAERISGSSGWQVVVDYRPGAGGIVAAEMVRRARPDGYALLVADSAHYAIKPGLYANLPYDPLRDFVPVSLAAAPPIFLVANAATSLRTVQELIALANSRPGISYGSSGNGAANHLAMELFKSMTGANLDHVPYQGLSALVPALLEGEVGVAFVGLPSVLPHARAGKLRILAIATARRGSLAPEIPTVAESGVPGFEVDLSMGLLAPAGTPPEVVARLNEEIVRALKIPDVRRRLEAAGIEPVGSSPEQFARAMRAERERFAMLVKTAGIRVD